MLTHAPMLNLKGEFKTIGSGEFSSSLYGKTDKNHLKKATDMIKKGSIMTPGEEPELLYKNPDYYSLIKKNVIIAPKEPDPSDKTLSTIKLSPKAYTYDGLEKTPEATVYAGTAVLKKDTDYTLSYTEGRKEVGEYKVEAKGIGEYSGTVSAFFKIAPKGTKITKVKRD